MFRQNFAVFAFCLFFLLSQSSAQTWPNICPPNQASIVFFEQSSISQATLDFLASFNLIGTFLIRPEWLQSPDIFCTLKTAISQQHLIGLRADEPEIYEFINNNINGSYVIPNADEIQQILDQDFSFINFALEIDTAYIYLSNVNVTGSALHGGSGISNNAIPGPIIKAYVTSLGLSVVDAPRGVLENIFLTAYSGEYSLPNFVGGYLPYDFSPAASVFAGQTVPTYISQWKNDSVDFTLADFEQNITFITGEINILELANLTFVPLTTCLPYTYNASFGQSVSSITQYNLAATFDIVCSNVTTGSVQGSEGGSSGSPTNSTSGSPTNSTSGSPTNSNSVPAPSSTNSNITFSRGNKMFGESLQMFQLLSLLFPAVAMLIL